MRVLMWAGAVLLIAVIAGGIALQVAISRDGPAVVDGLDRLVAGDQGSRLLEKTTYGAAETQKLSVWRKQGSHKPLPVMVFVHGGSWSWGDPYSYGFIGRNFAERGFLTVVAGYRLYPQAQYPAMLEDAAAAIKWARENAARLGGDPSRIWLVGHSAGAYNVVGAALERRWLEEAGVPEHAVAGVIGLSGPYDFYPFDSDSTRDSFGDASDPEATQPVNHVRADAPPLLLITGDEDTTVKPRNTQALSAAIEDIGGVVESEIYPGMDHNDPLLALANPWRSRRPVMDRIMQFTDRYAQHTQAEAAPSSLAVQADAR